jgi:hypothetical protein
MNKHIAKYTIRALASLSIIAAVSLSLYVAKPWRGNNAYQNPGGYVILAGFMTWGIVPHIALLLLSRHVSTSHPPTLLRLVTAVVVCIGGTTLLFRTIYLHPDPQSGLAFIFLPIYQLGVIGLGELILLAVRMIHTLLVHTNS